MRNLALAKSARGRRRLGRALANDATLANAAATGGFLLDGFDERRRVARTRCGRRGIARGIELGRGVGVELGAGFGGPSVEGSRARANGLAASSAAFVVSAFVVVVVVVVVVDPSVRSSFVRATGVSRNDSARGVAGARASAVAGANSKLASASSVGVAAGVRRLFSLTALSSFGTNRSLIVSRSLTDALPSPGRFKGVAPSPRRRTDACALTRCASTRAAYASYSSNAADPFFATYA